MLTQLKDPRMQSKKLTTMPKKKKTHDTQNTHKTLNTLNLIEIEVQFAQELSAEEVTLFKSVFKGKNLRSWVNWAIDPAAAHLKELAIRIVGAREGRRINLEFRGKDYATNILTFNYSEALNVQSDLVICAPVVLKEAVKLGVSLKEHCAHLIVHAVLHAQGYDHETNEADALMMESLESLLMMSLGFSDPYLT